MSSAHAPRLRRRALVTLLTASGTAVLAAGCGPSAVPTSPGIARDPLAELDPSTWDARSAEEMRALPVQGAAQELSTWADLGTEGSVVDPARDTVMSYLSTAYLAPAELSGLDDAEALHRVSEAAPEFWTDSLQTAWEGGSRPFYAFTLAEPFRTVGAPRICADWHRTERDDGPALAVGAVIAWTVIDTTTRDVGALAYRLGCVVDIGEEGGAVEGDLQLTLHGMDGCSMADQGGLVVPAIAADAPHQAVQKATHELVLSSPRIPLEQLMDQDAPLFAADGTTYLECS